MNLQHLKYAVEVERTGSITEAAENLFITQPSLSKAIRELENATGITIFERTSRGVLPTPKGRELLSRARIILKQVSGIEAIARGRDSSAREFSIAVPQGGYIAQGISRFITELDYSAPAAVEVVSANAENALELLSREIVSLAIIRYPSADETRVFDEMKKQGIKHEHIWEFEYAALFSVRNTLADAQELTPDKLAGQLTITSGEVPAYKSRASVRASDERAVYELLNNLQNSYAWASPMPAELLDRYSLVQRRADSGFGAQRDALVCLNGYSLTDLDRTFIDRLFEARNRAAYADSY